MKKILLCLAAGFTFFTSCTKEEQEKPYVPFTYTTTMTDLDGNVYNTVTINGHEWMAENLRVEHYSNGDTIEYATYTSDWDNAFGGATCAYDNAYEADTIYGRMYNGAAVMDPRGLAPPGWHIPTYYEWLGLVSYLGQDAGNKLREHGGKHWIVDNTEATDEYGFAALPGGWRDFQGLFGLVRQECYFWSSTYWLPSNAQYPENWSLRLIGDQDPVSHGPEHFLDHTSYDYGCYIRLVKD